MTTLNFFARKKDFAFVNRLIRECSVERLWYFWGQSELCYFMVKGNKRYMAEFNVKSEGLRVPRKSKVKKLKKLF